MSTVQRKCKTNALEQLFSNVTAVFRRFRPAKRTPASDRNSPEASGSWSLLARRRPSRSRFATFRGGDAGRSSTNGFGSARPPDVEFIEGRLKRGENKPPST